MWRRRHEHGLAGAVGEPGDARVGTHPVEHLPQPPLGTAPRRPRSRGRPRASRRRGGRARRPRRRGLADRGAPTPAAGRSSGGEPSSQPRVAATDSARTGHGGPGRARVVARTSPTSASCSQQSSAWDSTPSAITLAPICRANPSSDATSAWRSRSPWMPMMSERSSFTNSAGGPPPAGASSSRRRYRRGRGGRPRRPGPSVARTRGRQRWPRAR